MKKKKNSNMAPRLSVQNLKFSSIPLSGNSQKKLDTKKTKYKFGRKPQCYIRNVCLQLSQTRTGCPISTRVAKLVSVPSVTSNLREGLRFFPSLSSSLREVHKKACCVAIITFDNIDDTGPWRLQEDFIFFLIH